MDIRIKRVYAPPSPEDGLRILVDRLWPRGLTKERAAAGLWLREASPSDDLRRTFHKAPEEWEEFRRRYAAELRQPAAAAALERILAPAAEGRVTLLYAARDEERNNAAALRDYLLARGREE